MYRGPCLEEAVLVAKAVDPSGEVQSGDGVQEVGMHSLPGSVRLVTCGPYAYWLSSIG